MSDTISIKLPSKPEYVSIARLTASVLGNNIGFDIEEIEDIKVAVGEACNNAILHGDSEENYFELNFDVKEDRINIEVKDNGNGFKEEAYTEPDLENPKENGLGIFIMKSLMDEVEIVGKNGDGTKLVMTKYLE